MLDPKFLSRIHEKLASIVQGGDGPDRERALSLLAERHAKEICSVVPYITESAKHLQQWIFVGKESLPFEALADIQRDYLIALEPSAETAIREAGDLLSTDLWVEVAAGGLATEAKERVSDEIRSHYEEALEEEHGSGKEGVSAHLEALQRLGSPRAAAKIFRKTYLTKGEAWRLSLIRGHLGSKKFEHHYIVSAYRNLFNFAALSALILGPMEPLPWLLAFGGGTVVLTVTSSTIPSLVKRHKLRNAYVWIVVSASLLPIAWFWCFWIDYFSADRKWGASVYLLSGVFASAVVVYYLSWFSFLVRKRIRISDVEF